MGRVCYFRNDNKERCRTGSYDDSKERKKKGLPKLLLFKVPIHKKKHWSEILQISELTENHYLCELHFNEDDIVRGNRERNNRGKVILYPSKQSCLRRKNGMIDATPIRLSNDALPPTSNLMAGDENIDLVTNCTYAKVVAEEKIDCLIDAALVGSSDTALHTKSNSNAVHDTVHTNYTSDMMIVQERFSENDEDNNGICQPSGTSEAIILSRSFDDTPIIIKDCTDFGTKDIHDEMIADGNIRTISEEYNVITPITDVPIVSSESYLDQLYQKEVVEADNENGAIDEMNNGTPHFSVSARTAIAVTVNAADADESILDSLYARELELSSRDVANRKGLFEQRFKFAKVSLKRISSAYSAVAAKHNAQSSLDVDVWRSTFIIPNRYLSKIMFGADIEKCSFCISCFRDCPSLREHPIFCKFQLCEDCTMEYYEKLCVFEKGANKYCLLCGASGNGQRCRNQHCTWTFCRSCESQILCKPKNDNAEECCLCNPGKLDNITYTKVKSNWKKNVLEVLQLKSLNTNFNLIKRLQDKKEGIVVVSMFDGIGTGYLILKLLNIKVKKYYSCEIDENAVAVSTAHDEEGVIEHIGDVRSLTRSQIEKYGHIDLLLGAPPCNDLSRANPNRRHFGELSSAKLIYIYQKVREWIMECNKDHHLWWLMESTANMDKEDMEHINSVLGVESKILDAVEFSPNYRSRAWWTNLLWGGYPTKISVLQDFLVDDSVALTDKIATCTRNPTSWKTKINGILTHPVLRKDGKIRSLFIQEYEAIFGFPRSYTDVAGMSVSARKLLLGNAWNVHCVQQIMNCLKSYFSAKEQ